VECFDDPIPELKRVVGREVAVAIDGVDLDDLVELLEVDAPRISELRRQKLRRFSLETLLRFAQRLNRCPQITFAPTTRRRDQG